MSIVGTIYDLRVNKYKVFLNVSINSRHKCVKNVFMAFLSQVEHFGRHLGYTGLSSADTKWYCLELIKRIPDFCWKTLFN